MKNYEVVAAIIKHDDKFLCMQRGKGKFDYVSFKYEFPGGKVEKGEDYPTALMRELNEEMEMNLKIDRNNYFLSVSHEYPDFKINMHGYLIEVLQPDFKLKEHVSYLWLKKEELMKLDWAAADIPFVKKIIGEDH